MNIHKFTKFTGKTTLLLVLAAFAPISGITSSSPAAWGAEGAMTQPLLRLLGVTASPDRYVIPRFGLSFDAFKGKPLAALQQAFKNKLTLAEDILASLEKMRQDGVCDKKVHIAAIIYAAILPYANVPVFEVDDQGAECSQALIDSLLNEIDGKALLFNPNFTGILLSSMEKFYPDLVNSPQAALFDSAFPNNLDLQRQVRCLSLGVLSTKHPQVGLRDASRGLKEAIESRTNEQNQLLIREKEELTEQLRQVLENNEQLLRSMNEAQSKSSEFEAELDSLSTEFQAKIQSLQSKLAASRPQQQSADSQQPESPQSPPPSNP
jgi:hypothetical protein